MLANLGYFLTEAWQDSRRRPSAILSSLLSITLLLYFVAGVFAGGEGMRWLVGQLRQEASVTAFLTEDAVVSDVERLESDLKKIVGVTSVSFVSQGEAMEKMNQTLGEYSKDIADTVGFNPFLSYFEIGVQPELAGMVTTEVSGLPGIDSLRDNRQTLERLTHLSAFLNFGALAILFFVGLLMMITISHIVHLGMLGRAEEMEIYRLLGAGPWFAVMPFLLQGSLLGLAGGLLAFLLVSLSFPLLFTRLQAALPFLPLFTLSPDIVKLGLLLTLAGFVFGLWGSVFAQIQAGNISVFPRFINKKTGDAGK